MFKGSYVKIQNGKAIHIKYISVLGRRYVYSGAPFEMRIDRPKFTIKRSTWYKIDRFCNKIAQLLPILAIIVLWLYLMWLMTK